MAGSFLLVKCPDCENEQTVFQKASTEVACAVCGHTLARPTGGIAAVEGEVVDVVEDRTVDPLA
ncbi:30S ribosomal protein S27e [Halorarius litoreus]|uniref:30S ribosomal protein S27e n=1 Tax=Halorarius litoreus TaxID=2962676 RepID=UPI0020CF8A84|nr:30S ribosomal protein S27e [Halorarius litoreus]